MKLKKMVLVGSAVLVLLMPGLACQLTGEGNLKPSPTELMSTPTDTFLAQEGSSSSLTGATTQPVAQPTEQQEVKAAVDSMTPTATETLQAQPTPQEVIKQWGIGATASSQYGEEDWSPSQATGAPDTPECGDYPSAWASLMGGEEEWLEVYFETAVEPSELNIYQTYGATQITKVELLDTSGKYHEIYTGEPTEMECPFVMQIGIADWDYEAVAAKISFDESYLHNWNEIDAVELVGLSTGKVVATPAAILPTATPFVTPSGILWRVGGDSGPVERFSVPDGMDIAPDGSVYVADMMKGIIVYDPDGHQKNILASSDMDTIADVAVAPNGNVYVASWGNFSVLAYDAAGKFLWKVGEEGNGPGQFAKFSPQNLDVGPDGNIYVLDKNETNDDHELLRVQVFSSEGSYLREIRITENWFNADDIAFGPEGNLYILSGNAQYILVLDTEGAVVGRIGNAALSESYIYTALDLDAQGNIYIASGYLERGILKLDKYGDLVAQFGENIENGEREWSEGSFYAPNGLSVMPDGSAVFVSDWSGPYAYLTAFRFQ